ncbi:hypothetical protein PbJCM13498_36920 [Prolixibacter bellariivorans]|uniref:Uncharacterized protein n=1 Tax=Prolixibacter bellariivorans TaxID=314319 RepID=A0A5M4B3T6_9BACT|nr:hypothetical protein PbJCM13498_36920 [Prolixibacter bellariivorans]
MKELKPDAVWDVAENRMTIPVKWLTARAWEKEEKALENRDADSVCKADFCPE